MNEQVNVVNELLEAGEPANISVDSYSGYVGYKPQFVIDVLNQVFGLGGWGFSEISNQIVDGDKGQLAVAQVEVWIKDIESRPSGWGQSRVTKGDIGDARKGAQTDAIKKALSYFSIGNKAYRGELKEGGKTAQSQQQQRPPTPLKRVPSAAAPAMSRLDALKTRAKEEGWIVGGNDREALRAAWDQRMSELFGGALLADDYGKASVLGQIEAAIELYSQAQKAS